MKGNEPEGTSTDQQQISQFQCCCCCCCCCCCISTVVSDSVRPHRWLQMENLGLEKRYLTRRNSSLRQILRAFCGTAFEPGSFQFSYVQQPTNQSARHCEEDSFQTSAILQVILPRTVKYRCSETFDENNIKIKILGTF
ncbi:hypothetical protein CapIbe_018803 [Capra ibex]